MKARYIFFYLLKDKPNKIQDTFMDHINYWMNSGVEEFAGGPFADRTGGLITFVTSSLEEASKVIMQDPFIKIKVIDKKWIKEWVVEDTQPNPNYPGLN